MRYQVRFLSNNPPTTVDATEFHPMGGGVIFYKERMRNTLGNDAWGNPRRMPARVAVAYMTNIESILEIPEEEEIVAEGVAPFGDDLRVPPPRNFNQIRIDAVRAVGVPHMPHPDEMPGPPIGIDDDGVEWDEQRNE